ncbi:hypothetical protein GCM10010218_21030 [Streptomyces mashuensis]|uniref:Cellulose synthase n=1 Tax=Streptomyces mashuensis TaxID=33904 RepID=A0A919B2B3_9ACTN|nr:hypothetical protein [Streptomyces mashuensis]GHF39551.1 hypothetical protein GCM10010218_21030 [Streptomyces mashuensis]
MLTSTVLAAVSAAGLGIALVTAYRRRFLAATRIAAWSLIPVGLVLTGVVDWLTDIVLKPTVWAGFGVLALSFLLFTVSRAVERRSGGSRAERRERRAAIRARRRDAVAPASATPGIPAAPEAGRKGRGAKAAGGGDEDFSDIEAILKKHGI